MERNKNIFRGCVDAVYMCFPVLEVDGLSGYADRHTTMYFESSNFNSRGMMAADPAVDTESWPIESRDSY